MNYWTNYIFKDGSFWPKIALPGIGFILLLDILSYAFNHPGYFRLWPLKICIIIGIPVLIKIIYKNFHTLNKSKKVELEAPVFEKKREEEIRETIKNDPEFTTFCYQCVYFNDELKACSRDRIYERVKEISIGHRKYCLYWEEIKQDSEPSELI
ncbi:MAG: hypothetical protein ABFR36_01150 [Acidobacteriota bacterium]